MTKLLIKTITPPAALDSRGFIADAFKALAKGAILGYSAASAGATLDADDFIHINSTANAAIVIPDACSDNEGKVYIVQFTNATVTTAAIKDTTGNHVAAPVAQYDIMFCISTGAAWVAIGFDGCATTA